ncbi:nucleotidyltransferase [Candidatus Micrarchaeota archaeon CG10_big_fil_rev_8_21_14_0_10_45_29]|nr:MAG: nucleotidyltransferase [Candidatus Micrarchaeota archaeon CG10_big_fil_rev_8_21_14_0_10_45_29]
MNPENLDYLVYIDDMLDAVRFIKRHTKGLSKAQFFQNELVFEAVLRNIELVGEAASRIPENVRAKYPKIPWKKIVGTRNKLIHSYRDVNPDIVWDVIEKDLDSLEKQLKEIKSRQKK